MKTLLKNVRLETGYRYDGSFVTAAETEIFDVLMEDGVFKKIAPEITEDIETIDAAEQLMVPSFREMHAHIDKTYFGGEWKAPSLASEGIFTRFKEEAVLLPEQLKTAEERAHKVIRHYIRHGHTHIRTHVNVDPHIKTKHMEIVRRVLESYKGQITYEIVAFPQHGLLRNGEAFMSIFEDALQVGATHVGGVDPAAVDRRSSEVIQTTFNLAEKYHLGIDFHLHEPNTLGAFDIQQILKEIEVRSFQNEVTLSHAFALADLDEQLLDELTRKMAQHNVNITTSVPIGAGPVTIPVKYLFDNGVGVSTGHDSLVDHWSPFGSGNTVRKLNQLVQRFSYIDELNIGQSLKYATGGITALDKSGNMKWPKVGDPADVLLVDAVSSAHLIARQCPITAVISKGSVLHREAYDLKGELR